MKPVFLGLDDVLEIHHELIETYGGAHGVRDRGLLQSALAMPRMGSRGVYFHSDVYEMAGAYLFHVVKNHPFVDGNKRTGAITALEFLWLNGHVLAASGSAYERFILAVAESRLDKAAASAFLRKHTVA